MPIFILVFLFSSSSYAFLEFIGEQAKKGTEVAAYVDAVAEIAEELVPDEDIQLGAKDIQVRTEALRKQSANARYVSRNAETLLSGPDWSSKRLDRNIRSTTDYVKRFKRLLARIVILGNEGATALNTTETNVALNEIQKNQQTLILQNDDLRLRELERENQEHLEWSEFSDRQRRLRQSEGSNGKLQ